VSTHRAPEYHQLVFDLRFSVPHLAGRQDLNHARRERAATGTRHNRLAAHAPECHAHA
jgi:hypothetical protein